VATYFTTACRHCGQPFEAVRSDARTCSASCRRAALRARQEAEAASRVDRLRTLTDRHFDALRRGLAVGDLASVADELDEVDADAARDDWPPFPRLSHP
jgi:hypothetical protein